MNGAAPVLKVVPNTARHSCSRIPHLQAHIQSRQLRRARVLPLHSSDPTSPVPLTVSSQRFSSPPTPFQNRKSSSFNGSLPAKPTLLGDFWPTNDEDGPTTESERTIDRGQTQHALQSQKTVTQRRTPRDRFDSAIQSLHPDRVLFALQNGHYADEFIATAGDDTFSRAICALDPSYIVGRYIPLYRDIPLDTHFEHVYAKIRPLEDRFHSLIRLLDTLISRRREAGHTLTLEVCRHLLKCAGVVGNEHLAINMFDTLMKADHVEPDRECFNHYLTARVWSAWFDARFRYKTRVIKSHSDFRENSSISTRKGAAIMLNPDQLHPSSPEQIRSAALSTFEALSLRGLEGTEETYTSLMIGVAGAGDLETAKSILKSVWNINVDLLLQFDEEETESPTFYPDDSPLRPTSLLLAAIVEVFSNNNDVSLAYLLLDYVSRNYNIQIPLQIWSRLFEMTTLLSKHRRQGNAYYIKGQLNLGKVDRTAPLNLFRLMTDEPHNVQPNAIILSKLAEREKSGGNLATSVDYVRQAISVLIEQRTKTSSLYDDIVSSALELSLHDEELPVDFLDKRREFIYQSIEVEASLRCCTKAVRKILVAGERGMSPKWCHRGIPEHVDEFKCFLPNKVHYETPSGWIEIDTKMHRKYAIELDNDHFHGRIGLLRLLLDVDNGDILIQNLRALPKILRKRESHCIWCHGKHDGSPCEKREGLLAGTTPDSPRPSRQTIEGTVNTDDSTHGKRFNAKWGKRMAGLSEYEKHEIISQAWSANAPEDWTRETIKMMPTFLDLGVVHRAPGRDDAKNSLTGEEVRVAWKYVYM